MKNIRLITTCTLTALGIAILASPIDAQIRRKEVAVGGRVEIAVAASDPDGDPLTYTWTATGGRIVGDGARVLFDASDVAPGLYRATVTVSDSLCEANTTIDVEVLAPAVAAPVAASIGACDFAHSSGRASNACKAILDDAVARVAQDASATIVVVGSSRAGEPRGVARARAEAARAYLVNDRGVAASRVVARAGSESCDRGGVEIFFVPAGAELAPGASGCGR